MANPHGSFVWYELLTTDAEAASRFYGEVIGWAARDAGVPGVSYRLFSNHGQDVAGHMSIPEGAPAQMRPSWIGYVGVEDVDASVMAIAADGGRVHMPAMDMPGVGRMAMVSDPQGVPFYVMRGASDGESTSFSVTEPAIAAGTSSRRPTRKAPFPFTPAISAGNAGRRCRWARWATIASSITTAR
jgi:predicted enzyme related to lactoylglutathione lyase